MNHISVLDFLGMSPTFLIEGRKQKKTFFGCLLSIAVAIMLPSATGYFLGLLFSRQEYHMILTDEILQILSRTGRMKNFPLL